MNTTSMMKAYFAVALLVCICATQTRGVDARRLSATATVSATTSSTSLDQVYISGNLTGISATANATAASVAICQLASVNSTSTVQTIATAFAAVLINGTHGNITGQALSIALANTTNTTQQYVAQGYATAILAFYAANYTTVSVPRQLYHRFLSFAPCQPLRTYMLAFSSRLFVIVGSRNSNRSFACRRSNWGCRSCKLCCFQHIQ